VEERKSGLPVPEGEAKAASAFQLPSVVVQLPEDTIFCRGRGSTSTDPALPQLQPVRSREVKLRRTSPAGAWQGASIQLEPREALSPAPRRLPQQQDSWKHTACGYGVEQKVA